MSLDLNNISAGSIEMFRQMLIGSESRLVILQTARSGFYTRLGRMRKDFFLFSDPAGDVLKLLLMEGSVILEEGQVSKPVVLEQCLAIGYYAKAEGLNPGEYLVYSFMSRKAPVLASIRMWEFSLVKVGDVFRE